MERFSKSEERMAKELIELSRSVAEDIGVEERFARRLAIDSGNGREFVKTAVMNPLEALKWLAVVGGGGGASIGNVLKLAPAALIAAAAGIGIGGERFLDWAKRSTGIDPHAGLPWMIEPGGENMKDPIWKEPKGSDHIRDIPDYAEVPSAKLMPEYDEARGIEEDALRDAVRLPSEYGTSGDSGEMLRRRYMRPRDISPGSMVPGGVAYSPLDEVSARRMPRTSSGRPKFRRAAQLFTTPFGDPLVNAPDNNPFLGFAAPGDQETLTAVFADRPGVITPINQTSPRVLSPEEGARYSPQGGAPTWGAGRTPKESALLKLQALSDPRYSAPAMTAGLEAMYYQVLLQLRGGMISPQTAGVYLDKIQNTMLDAGVDPQIVESIRSNAISRLRSGGGGYGPRGGEGYEDVPYGGEHLEDPFENGRGALIENIEDTRKRMDEISRSSGMGGAAVQQDPMAGGLGMMNS